MRILFIDKVHPFLQKELEKRNYICDLFYDKNKEDLKEIINLYDGIIIRSRFNVDQEFIKKASKLKFIARAGSGMENINIKYAKSRKIRCYNAAEGNKQAVAEHALAMLLSLFNNLKRSDTEVREGIWNREENRGIELSGKTIGIIGYGNNGSAFAKLAEGFSVKILAYDKYLKEYPNKSSMKEIYKKANIISLHIPLTSETTYLVNKKFIEQFKKPIYLINTSRGKCVNTKDLISAIKNEDIKGACLDVLEYEKDSFEEIVQKGKNSNMEYLTNSEKVILSPHIAGWSIESHLKIAQVLLRKIICDFD
tara:strand:- start:178 stop:1104 length:927 start_codon:yes stop_codon:yes gene_type:complete